MTIADRQGMIDYCLRQLGGGVVNIEVTADQLEDRVNDAITYYQENHFDGIIQDFLVTLISGTTFNVADSTGFNVGDWIQCDAKSTNCSIHAINGNTLTIHRLQGVTGVNLSSGDVVYNNRSISTTITSTPVLGNVDKGYIDVDDSIVGVIGVLNAPFLSGSFQGADLLFSANYQLMAGQVQSLLSSGGTLQSYVGTMSYLQELEWILKKQKNFRFNRRMNKVFLDVNWDQDIAVGDYIVLSVYRALDDATYSKILNDIWLKRYTTALIKKQWGQNLKKYKGMTLPGGLTFDGQTVFDEAVSEVKDLEQEAIEKSAVLGIFVG